MMEDFSPKPKLDPETLERIERLKKMKPEIPKVEESKSIGLRPPERPTEQAPKKGRHPFVERSLPNGDRD